MLLRALSGFRVSDVDLMTFACRSREHLAKPTLFRLHPIFLLGPELYFLVLGATGRPYALIRVSIGSGYQVLLLETSSVKTFRRKTPNAKT